MSDDRRLQAVVDAYLAHHGEPEDMHDEGVVAARQAGAIRHAELFLAMLTAASSKQEKPVRKIAPVEPVETDDEDTE